ncbi:hypothetical protein IF188_04210 [Microbacterium sp. NEAU-LLC]|uniref:Uncharacterized protein n=1 Tax=Microbacterium helvum TaxID=2773713 RepID=A0ABR8NJR9_9MICO|nr:hypothetical protein [Microbacterium helvum]MBD3940906.1 hypothetical protein [Microbacterium helvum]
MRTRELQDLREVLALTRGTSVRLELGGLGIHEKLTQHERMVHSLNDRREGGLHWPSLVALFGDCQVFR